MKRLLCKLTALLLVTALAMSVVSFSFAEAETVLPAGPVTAEFSVKVNGDGLFRQMEAQGTVLPDESLLPAIGSLFKIVGRLSFRVTVDGTNFTGDVLIDGESLADFSGSVTEEQVLLVSSMLPEKTALALVPETSVTVGGVEIPELTAEQKEGLIAAVAAQAENLEARIGAALGEEETGSWIFEDVTFTSRRRINITTKELAAAAMTAFGELLKDPAVVSVVTAMGGKPDSVNIEEEIANLNNSPDDSVPALDAYIYSNSGGDAVTDIGLSNEKGSLTLRAASIGALQYIRFNESVPLSAELALDLVLNTEERSWKLNLTAASVPGTGSAVPKREYTFTGSGAATGEGAGSGTVALLSGNEELLAVDFTYGPGSPVAPVDVTGMKVVTNEDLAGMSEKESQQFTGQIVGNLLRLLAKLSLKMPDEVGELMTYVMPLVRK